MYSVIFSVNKAFILKNGVPIYSAKLENNLYVVKSTEAKTLLNHEMFKIANTQTKRQRITPRNNSTYLWHLRLGHINFDRIRRLVKNGLLNDLEDD